MFNKTIVAALRGGGWNVRTLVDEPVKRSTSVVGTGPAASALAAIFGAPVVATNASLITLRGGEDVGTGFFAPMTMSQSMIAADPPRMLEYTRKYDDGFPATEETVIRYDLEACDEGTRLIVRHSGFATQEMAELHRHGWERVFEWLDHWLIVRHF